MRSVWWLGVAALLGCGGGGGGAPDGGGADASDSSVTPEGGSDASVGPLDPTFGDGGVATTSFGLSSGDVRGRAVLRQQDGKILLVAEDFDNDGLLVGRVDPSTKSFDAAYGQSGRTLVHGLPYVPNTFDFFAGPNPAGDTLMGGAALQPDGKLVVAENLGLAGTDVVRLDASGALDPSFGTGGRASVPSVFACSVAVQSDGKIVLAGGGTSSTGPIPLAVARLDATGAPDAAFGAAGVVTTTIGTTATAYAFADGVAIDPKGRVVVAGPSGDTMIGGRVMVVARYTSSGAPDASFATTGLLTTTVTSSGFPNVQPFAVQADERILVGGLEGTTINAPTIVERLNEDGTTDATFGTSGVATVPGGDVVGVQAIALAADGSIGVVTEYSVSRLTTAGALDAAFNATFPTFDNFQPSALAIRSDGTYDVAGNTNYLDAQLVHLSPSGAYDTNAYASGYFSMRGESATEAVAVALQPDGKILAGGPYLRFGSAVARYLPSGALDTTFQPKLSPGTLADGNVRPLRGLALDASGRIVIAGGGSYGSNAFEAARLMPDGTYDTTFASGGHGTYSLPSLVQLRGHAMTLDSSGHVVLAGEGDFYAPSPGGTDLAIVRLTSAGAMDATFGGGGWQQIPVGDSRDAFGLATAAQPDGSILVAGTAKNGGKLVMSVVRVRPDASLDPTFVGDGPFEGTVLLDVSKSTTTSDVARGIALESDGKILLVGDSSSPALDTLLLGDYVRSTTSSIVVARLLPDGKLDATFGTGGVFTSTLGGAGGMAFGATIASDGRILVGGRLYDGRVERGFVIRLTSGGALDTSFATQGLYTLGAGAESGVRALAFQPDGKLVIAGHTFDDPTGVDLAVARLITN